MTVPEWNKAVIETLCNAPRARGNVAEAMLTTYIENLNALTLSGEATLDDLKAKAALCDLGLAQADKEI